MKKTFRCKKLPQGLNSKKKKAEYIARSLEALYPNAACSLDYENDPFRLLVMARLSAQCTDKRVNIVSKELFSALPDPKSFAEADIEVIEDLIKSCGLYKMKAKNVKDMSTMLVEKYNGEVPSTKDELLSLPGIGIKIANLMMGDLFDDPHIVPDTHCIRISHRLGLVSKPDATACLKELEAVIPKEKQSDFCHRIVLFGRDFCKAQNPLCENCPINAYSIGEK